MSSHADMGTDLGAIEDPKPEEVKQARKVVAANALDIADCRMLLNMLGIGPKAGR